MLEFSITTLRYPDGPAPIRVAKLMQYTGGEVIIPLNEMRSAQVTISIFDMRCTFIKPLETMLYVTYNKQPVFWGPITDPVWDLAGGVVTINALGPEFRMSKHYLRQGDDALNGDTVEGTTDINKGILYSNANGYYLYLQAANNIALQNDRNVPDLGIQMDDLPPATDGLPIEVSRGDECFAGWVNLSEQASGLDFNVVPYPFDTTEEYYAQLDLNETQGDDKTDTLIWHFGWGQDNLETFTPSPQGSAVVTHDHVLSSDGLHRGTAVVLEPSERFGVYVQWDALNQNAEDDVLADYGKKAVLDYGEPPIYIDCTLKADTEERSSLKYLEDFIVGDIGTFVGKRGYAKFAVQGRITQVKLTQNDGQAQSKQSIQAVPNIYLDPELQGEQ